MNRNKKRVAAVSAVLAYMREEAARRVPSGAVPSQSIVLPNIWGTSGRQAQMQLRSMIQLKGFHGSRLR